MIKLIATRPPLAGAGWKKPLENGQQPRKATIRRTVIALVLVAAAFYISIIIVFALK